MTIYFAATESEAFSGSFFVNSATAAYRDTVYSRCALGVDRLGSLTFTLDSEVGTGTANGWWLHGKLVMGSSASTTTSYDYGGLISVYDGAAVLAFDNSTTTDDVFTWRLIGASAGTNTTTWSPALVANSTVTIDIHCYTSGSDARADFYVNAVQVGTLTVASTTNRGLKTVTMKGPYSTTGSAYAAYWSEFIVSDLDTRFLRAATAYFVGQGNYSAWLGSYADIDEIDADSNYLVSDSVGQMETCDIAFAGVIPTSNIIAIAHNALVAGDGMNDIQLVCRVNSADYVSADLGIGTSLVPKYKIWEQNPDTAAAWGSTDDLILSGVEFGFKSVA